MMIERGLLIVFLGLFGVGKGIVWEVVFKDLEISFDYFIFMIMCFFCEGE